MALHGQCGHLKWEEPSLLLPLPHGLPRQWDASLLTPETRSSGGIAPVGCIAGDCLKAEGPGCAGDVPWRRALAAGSKLIQMLQQRGASCCLPRAMANPAALSQPPRQHTAQNNRDRNESPSKQNRGARKLKLKGEARKNCWITFWSWYVQTCVTVLGGELQAQIPAAVQAML